MGLRSEMKFYLSQFIAESPDGTASQVLARKLKKKSIHYHVPESSASWKSSSRF